MVAHARDSHSIARKRSNCSSRLRLPLLDREVVHLGTVWSLQSLLLASRPVLDSQQLRIYHIDRRYLSDGVELAAILCSDRKAEKTSRLYIIADACCCKCARYYRCVAQFKFLVKVFLSPLVDKRRMTWKYGKCTCLLLRLLSGRIDRPTGRSGRFIREAGIRCYVFPACSFELKEEGIN